MVHIKTYPIDSRLTTLPIPENRRPLWNAYKACSHVFWLADEIAVGQDYDHYENKLNSIMQKMVSTILAFFSSLDTLVNVNILGNIRKQVDILEVNYFYDFQMAMENIHSETYAKLLYEIIRDPADRELCVNSVTRIPIIGKMVEYLKKCDNAELSEVLLRQACVEGIFFQSPFCIIFWFGDRGLMPGLTQSNQFIARDEGMHAMFAALLYRYIPKEHRLSEAEAHNIVHEAVELGIELAQYMLLYDLPGLSINELTNYVRQMGDIRLVSFEYSKKYNIVADLPFMKRITMPTIEQFFEIETTNYSKDLILDEGDDFSVLDDF